MTKINNIYPTKTFSSCIAQQPTEQDRKTKRLYAPYASLPAMEQFAQDRKSGQFEKFEATVPWYNKITRLENLGNLKSSNSSTSSVSSWMEQCGSTLTQSLCALANHLKVLNIKKLKLANIDALEPLWKLEILLASENNFKSTDDITPVISALYSLRVLDLQGCSAQRDVHYREKVTAAAGHKLLLLDGKMISQSTRNFIKNFQTVKLEKQRRASEKPKTADTGTNSKSSFESVSERSNGTGGFVDPFSAVLPHKFPGNSLFQVSTRRPACTRVLRKP
uniref:Uncharacterized protein n=1 Tax=Anopheles funestus TaxID=62324 RepID=A0A182RX90_ANOFN